MFLWPKLQIAKEGFEHQFLERTPLCQIWIFLTFINTQISKLNFRWIMFWIKWNPLNPFTSKTLEKLYWIRGVYNMKSRIFELKNKVFYYQVENFPAYPRKYQFSSYISNIQTIDWQNKSNEHVVLARENEPCESNVMQPWTYNTFLYYYMCVDDLWLHSQNEVHNNRIICHCSSLFLECRESFGVIRFILMKITFWNKIFTYSG